MAPIPFLRRRPPPLPAAVATLWCGLLAFGWPALAPAQNTAVEPVPRPEEWWQRQHQNFVRLARAGGIDALFIGDSITAGWAGAGGAVWDRVFAPLKAANFGINGDRTEHVLWRLRNGELDGIAPKAVVLMIGTNNLRSGLIRQTAEQTAEGVAAILRELRARLPETRILLMGILPRHPKYAWIAEVIAAINARLSALAEKDPQVAFLDIGPRFLGKDGAVDPNLMPDLLHPNRRGYEIWAESIIGFVREMLGPAAEEEK